MRYKIGSLDGIVTSISPEWEGETEIVATIFKDCLTKSMGLRLYVGGRVAAKSNVWSDMCTTKSLAKAMLGVVVRNARREARRAASKEAQA